MTIVSLVFYVVKRFSNKLKKEKTSGITENSAAISVQHDTELGNNRTRPAYLARLFSLPMLTNYTFNSV